MKIATNSMTAMVFWMTRVRWADGEFSAHFTSRGSAESLTELADGGFGVRRWRFRALWAWLRNRRRGVCGLPKARKSPAQGHDVSGTAPSSCMKRAQRSRIAEHMSSMAALIFKNTCRPWRTIAPAV
jgi:hypothetical protein